MFRAAALIIWVSPAVALHAITGAEQPLTKKVVGPEHRHCRAGAKRTLEDSSIIGGTVVKDEDKYPFLAWIGDNDGTGMAQFCGGSLISDRIVLTAAHCVYKSDILNSRIYVRLGLANFGENPGVARDVINWKKHEHYNSYSMFNDIAIFLLNESVPADVVAPVELSDGTGPFEKEGVKRIIGWGSTDEECKLYDESLRESDVPLGEYGKSCSTPGSKVLTPEMDFDYTRQLCAGQYLESGKAFYPGCGDSGGPILQYDDGKPVQVGFVSWSYGAPFPDVFTRVSAFRDWINTTRTTLENEGPFKWD